MICPLCNKSWIKDYPLDQNKLASIKRTFFKRDYYICDECDLMSMDTLCQLTPDEEFNRYKQHQNSDTDTKYREYIGHGVDLVVQWLSKLNPVNSLHSKIKSEVPLVLDFGSGATKTAASIFKNHGIKCDSFDPYFFNDKITEKYYCVYACEVVEHFRNPFQGWTHMCDLLKPNGFIFVKTQLRPTEDKLKDWWYLRDATHVSLYSEKTLLWIEKKFQLKLSQDLKNNNFIFLKGNKADD